MKAGQAIAIYKTVKFIKESPFAPERHYCPYIVWKTMKNFEKTCAPFDVAITGLMLDPMSACYFPSACNSSNWHPDSFNKAMKKIISKMCRQTP